MSWERFLRERQALAETDREMIEVTAFGGTRQWIDNSPTPWDYAGLARAAYLRGDLTVEAFEQVLDIHLGLQPGNLAVIAADGPEWVIPTRTLKQ